VEVLWPQMGRPLPARPSDDDSLVLKISKGEASVLLAGDIGQAAEKELATAGRDLRCRVLKVAQHGAATSSGATFLARVAPSVALVTADRRGSASTLSSETLDRLRSMGAQIFRTDVDGATTVTLRGSDLVVRSYRNHSAARASATFSPVSPSGLATSRVR
jgi:competence protein ComEC